MRMFEWTYALKKNITQGPKHQQYYLKINIFFIFRKNTNKTHLKNLILKNGMQNRDLDNETVINPLKTN